MVSWLVGSRHRKTAERFIADVASRLANRVQITTDGSFSYISAIENAFGWAGADFAQLVKTYGEVPEEERRRRYSPAVCTGAVKTPIMGRPDMDLVSTSYVERANLTMRMSMRRFTRLTNGFSKKAQNLAAAVALHFMHYNFALVHQSLRITPAMAAGVTDHVWEIEEIVALLDAPVTG